MTMKKQIELQNLIKRLNQRLKESGVNQDTLELLRRIKELSEEALATSKWGD